MDIGIFPWFTLLKLYLIVNYKAFFYQCSAIIICLPFVSVLCVQLYDFYFKSDHCFDYF